MGKGVLILPGMRRQAELFDPEKYDHPAGVIGSAASCEQYTPEHIWKPGLSLYGVDKYDLDPSTWEGSPIPCKRVFTRADDGLSQDWVCDNLWSNFPYSDKDPNTGKKKVVMSKWVKKLCDEYQSGNVKSALTLVKSDCRPEWFHQLLEISIAHLFIKGGVKFISPDKENGTSFFGSVLFYLGDHPYAFKKAYEHLGIVGCKLDIPF